MLDPISKTQLNDDISIVRYIANLSPGFTEDMIKNYMEKLKLSGGAFAIALEKAIKMSDFKSQVSTDDIVSFWKNYGTGKSLERVPGFLDLIPDKYKVSKKESIERRGGFGPWEVKS